MLESYVNPVRIAVVGLGAMGGYLAGLYAEMAEYELAAICDSDVKRLEETRQRLGVPGYAELGVMLAERPDIEVVDLAVKSDFHLPPALECIEAGRHVLAETPLATRVADGVAIARAAEAKGVLLMVNESLRFDPRYAAMIEAVQRGEIGEVSYMTARRTFTQRVARRAAGRHSIAWEVGQHDIDLMLWLAGSPVTKVFAKGRTQNLKDLGVHDVILSMLTFDNGALAVIEHSWGLPEVVGRPKSRMFQVRGTCGMVEVDGYESGVTVYSPTAVRTPETHWMARVHGISAGVYRNQALYFAQAVAKGKDVMQTARHNLEAMRVQEAIQRSIESGVEVSVVS